MPILLTYVPRDMSSCPGCYCRHTASHISEEALQFTSDVAPQTQRREEEEANGAQCVEEERTLNKQQLPCAVRCFNNRTMTGYDIRVLNNTVDNDSNTESSEMQCGVLLSVQREPLTEAALSYTLATLMHSRTHEPFLPPMASVTWADVLRAVLHEVGPCDAQSHTQYHKPHASQNKDNTTMDEYDDAVLLMSCNVRFVLLPAEEAQASLRTSYTKDTLLMNELPMTAPLYTRAAREAFLTDDIESCFAYYHTNCLLVYLTLNKGVTEEKCDNEADVVKVNMSQETEGVVSERKSERACTPEGRTPCPATPPAPRKSKANKLTSENKYTAKRQQASATLSPSVTSKPRRLLAEFDQTTVIQKKKQYETVQSTMWSHAALVQQLRGCYVALLRWQDSLAEGSHGINNSDDVTRLQGQLEDMLHSNSYKKVMTNTKKETSDVNEEEEAYQATLVSCPVHARGAWRLSLLECYCDTLLESAAVQTTVAARRERLLRCAAVGQKVLCVIERLARLSRQQQEQQQYSNTTVTVCQERFPFDLLRLLLACLRLRTLRHLALLVSAITRHSSATTTTLTGKQRECLLQIRCDALYTMEGLLQQVQPYYESNTNTSLLGVMPALKPTLRLAALSLTEMAVYLAVDIKTPQSNTKVVKKMRKMRHVCEPLKMIEAALYLFSVTDTNGMSGVAPPPCVVEALRLMQTRCPAQYQQAIAAQLLQLLQTSVQQRDKAEKYNITEEDEEEIHRGNTTHNNMPPCIGYALRPVWSVAAADRLFIRAQLLHDTLSTTLKE